jgi:DNA-binding SARP family transcriptional activator
MDELAEALCQRLICCYQQLGLRAEALAAHHRCREALSRVLGLAPSPKTEALSLARMT